MPSRSRERELAKQHARRQEERQRAARRKRLAAGVVGAVVGLAVIAIGVALFTGSNDQGAGNGSPTPSGQTSPSAGPSLPKETGTVTLQATLPKTVACGAQRPSAVDAPKPQFDSAPSPDLVLDPNKAYTAVMKTSCGTIRIALDAQKAPNTVASFVFLADEGYYDGTWFHRVVDSIDVVQGGDPLGTGGGGPGYTIPDELTGKEHYAPGALAMANAGPNSGGSQFFLITGPDGANLDVNPNYTIFGTITDGLDVAKKINALMPAKGYDGPPTDAVFIDRLTIETAPVVTGSPSATPSA
jgi:cyclophilin family peptidyl-prolyl cis-trans isomerase